MCLMHTDLPVPEGPRIIEICPSGRLMFRPRSTWLRPNDLCTSMNSIASRLTGHRWRESSPVARTRNVPHPRAGPRAGDCGRELCLPVRLHRCGVMLDLLVGLLGGSPPLAPAILGHVAQPPIGARGFAPQKTCVPSMPIMCTSTMLSTIDLAVAVPTPTGPPLAL